MRTLLAALLLLAAATASAQDTRRLTLVHDGAERTAILDLPRAAGPAPLLIALHGGIGGAEMIRRRAAVTLPAQGWVVAWPSALGDWADGRRDRRGRPYDDADDLGFLRALVDRLAAEGRVDPARVFIAGPSIGGMMALRVACEAPDLIAGAAVAIASLPEGLDCPEDGPPLPMLFLHGDADGIVPPDGGRIGGDSILVRDRGRVRPMDETIGRFAARNGCGAAVETALPDRDPTDASTALQRVYQDCAAPLIHYVVQGGGHTWPGSRPFRMGGALVGATNQDFSATRALERFFLSLIDD